MTQAATQAAVNGTGSSPARWPTLWQRLLLTLIAAAAGSLLGLHGLSTPTPAGRDVRGFSATRAAEVARSLLGDAPRPAGSEASKLAVERLADHLRRRGLEVQVDQATVKRQGKDVTIRNVIARRSGTRTGPSVLLMAHHDSAVGSPGAGDDGMGVAILLEAAESLYAEGPSRPWQGRDVILLLTDGEESGLLGARHFVANHPWHEHVGAVINIDNRGNGGPCLLYETSGDDARLLQAAGPELGPVVANSLFAEVARRMPNSTDLAVFRELGTPGLNFALVDGHQHYHAPTDTWQNASLSSLQHAGPLVISAMQALADQPEDGTHMDGRAVFLDLGGAMLAWWPARAGITFALGCTVVILGSTVMGCKRRQVRLIQLPPAATAMLARALVAAAVSGGLLWVASLIGLYGMDAAKSSNPEAGLLSVYRAAFWPTMGPALQGACMVAGGVAAWLVTRPLLRRLDGMAGLWGSWVLSAVLVTMVAFAVPGVSAPLLPVLVTATVAIAVGVFVLDPEGPLPALLALAAPAFVAGLTLAPVEALSWIGIGLSMPLFTAARAAIYAVLLLPALAASRGRLAA